MQVLNGNSSLPRNQFYPASYKKTYKVNFHLNPLLFKDIDVPKETWFWIEPEEEDKKDEEDKEDECTSSDLSVSSSTELIAQFRIKLNIP